ncbi:hypothetical protein SETIT_7G219000v2 [Setaria italica]|uniref:Uncharacterized protein n=2 Tax=Setaria TaxID=4554 RepID=K3YDQ7_SETIT|nr:hypothetical protein SETIT_7G219000v2 [Setaria italica]TKW06251.1 hypothetical protein SEVIR_7G230700v2 [Setaria viridis]
MDSFCIQMPTAAPEEMADAAHDGKKLVRILVGGGAGKAAAALVLALHRSPGGVFLRGRALVYAYYGVLVAVALLGAVEVAVGFWVAGDPDRRRRWGRLAVWVSVIPLVVVAGLGGFAVLK